MVDHSFRNTGLGLVLVAWLAGCGGGCSKTSDAAGLFNADTALVEVLGNGSIAWIVGGDGKILAQVRDKDGKPISKDAKGTVEWRTESGEPKTATLAYDDGAKALVTMGPAPKAEITELKYDIKAEPGALNGVLQVPVGGTAALVADGKPDAAATAEVSGPNGGTVQAVGDDRVEIVADDDSDEVRVYVLDANGKPIPGGERKITLAVAGDSSEVITLVPSADGLYFTGTLKAKSDPSRVTIVIRRAGVTHVAIVGWKPGVKLVVAGGPKVKVKKHGLGWGAGGKPVELRGKEGAGITPSGIAVRGGLKDDHGNKGNDDDKDKDKGKGHGQGKGGGKGK